jgi:hypothetical protein
MGCTPTSGANGANASKRAGLSGDEVLALVKPSEETSPTPGWSLDDLQLAMDRAGVPFSVRSGKGWAGVVAAHDAGLYVAIQGDSDRFGSATCSGKFDGDHCIGGHPASQVVGGVVYWWIDDPICPAGRWERASVIRAYAEKFSANIKFGVFTTPVPKSAPALYRVTISGVVPVFSRPYGVIVGHVKKADYTATRTRSTSRWWYRIKSRHDGTPSAFAGRYVPQEQDPPMRVTPE